MEHYTTRARNSYRVVTKAYCDMDEWESGIEVDGRAYAAHGWRRWLPYKEHRVRGGPDDPVGEPPAWLDSS
jgi:hypothetical protein